MARKYGLIKTGGIVLIPKDPSLALAGELYRDLNNSDALTDQSTGGTDTQIGAASADSLFTKLKFNSSGSIIPAYTIVALQPNGSVVPADSDGVGMQYAVGITKTEIAVGAYGQIGLRSANLAGVLTGLGIIPGQVVYLNNTGANRGFMTDLTGIDPSINSIVKMGYADVGTNTIGNVATDLILIGEDMSRPV